MKMQGVMATAIVLLALTTMPDVVAENGYSLSKLAGRKFAIKNVFPFDGIPPCPQTNPTVSFYPGSSGPLSGTVVILGDWDAANLGVCNNPNTQYAVSPFTPIQYFIYGDWILFHVSDGRVGSALDVVYQQGQIYTIGITASYVSVLTDIGKAPPP